MMLYRNPELKINGSVLTGSKADGYGLSGLVPSVWPPRRPFSGPLFFGTAPLCPAGPGAGAFQQPSGQLLLQPPGPSPSWLKSRRNLSTCHTRGMLCGQGEREQEGKMY